MDNVSKAFIDDLRIDGMLHCVVLRSRISRGTIREVITPDLPPDVRLIGAADLPGRSFITLGNTEIPLLTESSVEHQGQAIALLCGEREQELHRLIELFEIQYDRRDPLKLSRDFKADQKLITREIVIGNTAAAFEKAFHVIEGEYRYEPKNRDSLTPAGALAVPGDGGIMVATPTKWLFHVREAVASATGIDSDSVQIKCTRVTRVDGNGIWYPSLAAAQTAAAAVVTGRPVRMIAGFREKRQLLTRRAGCIITHKTALSKAGKVTAMEIKVIAESGAFPLFPVEHLDRLCLAASNGYASRSLKIEGVQIKTSAPTADIHGGLGFDGGFFAMEIHATRLAELCNEDPTAWRLKNLRPERGVTLTRTRVGPTPQRKLMDVVAEASDFSRKYSANGMLKIRRNLRPPIPDYLRGIGIASCFHGGGFMNESKPDSASVTVRLDNQGKLSIRSSSATAPGSTAVTYANSAARILNLDMAMIHVEPADTALVPDSGPAVFSRETTVVHDLMTACCQAIQKQRFRAPLPMEVSRNRAGGRGRRWDPEAFRGVPFSPLSWASCVVEIELDAVSFEIAIRGVWIALHVGALADEKKAAAIVENELKSAFEMCGARGVATGTAEPLELSIRFVQGTGARPAALDGIAANAFAPAFVTAVSQAAGFYFDSLPLSRSLILQYVET